jgi:hypothetical protein
MIDVQARSKLAEASRRLVSGLITNWQYDDHLLDDGQVFASEDPALREIYNKGFWLLYDDLRQYRLSGPHRLSEQSRRQAVRCIMFLKSGLPYSWPILSRWAAFLLTCANLLTLGLAGLAYSRWAKRGRDISYWPFTTAAQYNEALQSAVYLSGGRL